MLEIKKITKTFGDVVANNDVSFSVARANDPRDRWRKRGG